MLEIILLPEENTGCPSCFTISTTCPLVTFEEVLLFRKLCGNCGSLEKVSVVNRPCSKWYLNSVVSKRCTVFDVSFANQASSAAFEGARKVKSLAELSSSVRLLEAVMIELRVFSSSISLIVLRSGSAMATERKETVKNKNETFMVNIFTEVCSFERGNIKEWGRILKYVRCPWE